MEPVTMFTLRQGPYLRSFAFCDSEQSVLWLGMNPQEGPSGAVACVERGDAGLVLSAASGVRMRMVGQASGAESLPIEDGAFLMLELVRRACEVTLSLYVSPFAEASRTYVPYLMKEGSAWELGSDAACLLSYVNPYVSKRHAHFFYEGGILHMRDLVGSTGTFLNGLQVDALQTYALHAGDLIRVADLCMVVGDGVLFMNQPPQLRLSASLPLACMKRRDIPAVHADSHSDAKPFYPAPWLAQTANDLELEVEGPPAREDMGQKGALAQLGPGFLMSAGSVLMAVRSASGLVQGGPMDQNVTSLFMAAAMLVGGLAWPLAVARYERQGRHKREARRREVYVTYLDRVEDMLQEAAAEQAKELRRAYLPLGELLSWAHELSPLLMSHTASQKGFLTVRVGVGNKPFQAKVTWPHKQLALDADLLWNEIENLRKGVTLLEGVPRTLDLLRHANVGVAGDREVAWEFVRGMVVQVCALHSYADVRLALVADECDRSEWDPLVALAHLHDETGTHCYLALSSEGVSRLCTQLKQDLGDAPSAPAADEPALPHFVVICATTSVSKRGQAFASLAQAVSGGRVSMVCLDTRLHNLPRECGYIVELGMRRGKKSGYASMYARSGSKDTCIRFEPDMLVSRKQMASFALDMGKARLLSSQEACTPVDSLGFLDLYGAGNLRHLDIARRWGESDAALSLSVPVGIDAQGQPVLVDLHERADGPHALIAGTTGSGKSAFIVTLVLSLCVNFSPSEVAFVLIDYKGGDLAGDFASEGFRLDHLAGTITNLDGSEVRRALASLRSELRRRQKVLNEARQQTGETTMDINRYLELWKRGRVRHPLPHLFVIADEFAELKQEEPEFMDELISAARIGRSLGIHLVLATQKPTGVINDQIWANARTKISLKVSEAADSREMIRRDDAASLVRPGSFYLLVGYDERFLGGQAAYAEGLYVPKERYEPPRDLAVYLLDAEGQVRSSHRHTETGNTCGESEIQAVLKEVHRLCKERSLAVSRLWLDPLPAVVTARDLDATEDVAPSDLCVAAGLLDDPAFQCRRRYDIDLEQVGNVLICGCHGSDAEGYLRALALAFACVCDASGLWIYIAASDAETMRPLLRLPHTGGLVELHESERMHYLLALLEEELAHRRSKGRCAKKAAARVLVCVSNLPALVEAHPSLEERMARILRDGPSWGLHVLATADSVLSLHLAVRGGFGLVVPTLLADPQEYALHLGAPVDVVPHAGVRRGVVLFEGRPLELQGLTWGDGSQSEEECIARTAESLAAGASRVARIVPAFPHMVVPSDLGSLEVDSWPLGISRRSLAPTYLSLRASRGILVTGNDQEGLAAYLRGVHDLLGDETRAGWRFVDMAGWLGRGHDPTVAIQPKDVEALLLSLAHDTAVRVIVLLGATDVVRGLSPQARQAFEEALLGQNTQGGTTFAFVSEAWRLSSLYDDWYRSVAATRRGVWVGDGFGEQTVFALSRLPPDSLGQTAQNDGFLVGSGGVEPVRLLGTFEE